MLVDSHCHIHLYEKVIWHNIIKESFSNNITYLLNVSVDLDDLSNMEDISNLDARILSSIGIHPCNTSNLDINIYKTRENMDKLLLKKTNSTGLKIVALGETGLDLYHSGFDIKKQIEFFELHIELSNKYNIPIIIHSRNADKQMIEFLKTHKPFKGVMHSFASSEKLCKAALDSGLYISFSGIVTLDKATTVSNIAQNYVPEDMILSETDSPYLIPKNARKQKNIKQNHPKFVKYVVDHLSNIRKDDMLIHKIKNNFEKLFIQF